jgi:drug/metabolite transporter (DMT)-like permease
MQRLPLYLFALATAFHTSSCDAFSTRRASACGGRTRTPTRATCLKYQSNATDAALTWKGSRPLLPAILDEDETDALLLLPKIAPLIRDDDDEQAASDATRTASASASPWSIAAGMSDVVKARLLLLGAAALYGTNFSLVKILGETDMSVGLSSTLRFGFAAMATLPWLLAVSNKEEKEDQSRLQKLFDPKGTEFQAAMGGLEVGMWNSIGYVAQAVGLASTSASKSAFLCSLAVVMVPILDYLAGKTLLSKQVIGALLAVVGVGFLELEGTGAAASLQALSPEDIASLVQPFAFGMGFWRMEAAMARYPNEAGRATAAQLLAIFLGSASYMLAAKVFLDPATIPNMEQLVSWLSDPVILAGLLWTGVVTTAMTIYMETSALKTLSAAETTLIFSTEPLWGTAFASVVMGETLGMNAAAGAFMIVAACVYSNLGLDGLLGLLPGRNKADMEETTNREIERFELAEHTEASSTANQSMFPRDLLDKFPLKSNMAGALAGVVATIKSLPL